MTATTAQTSAMQRAPLNEFLDDRALAELLCISENTPAQWRFTGKFSDELPFYKFGRCVRYRREDIDAFIAKRRVGSVPATVEA
ncbi:Helix-turn-helix domain-containing protein [Paraburkholderia phenazinium]|uniref:Helix-turn-helix domain-containing protein n=1 Tax=Paraburkholderia phenazinium TaxID=60549 RepID=A0A1G8KF34_9BURK|nr:helix-turn-helix domain-containing protein [Paraburkholderia phenazinium]SDI42029.1 Helix-turn-helix domain-containing protein [Paraburkholderia phenazinium]